MTSGLVSQHFFADGAYLGSRQIDPWRRVPGLETRWHHSQVLFCPHCGDIWGRIMVDRASYTQCIYRPCAKHGDGRLACYPSWYDDPTLFADDWPPAAIRWEFERTLAYSTKEER